MRGGSGTGEGKNNKLAAAREAARKAVTQGQRNERERQHGKTKSDISRKLDELRNAESATGEEYTSKNNERSVGKEKRRSERERRKMALEEYQMKPPETRRDLNVAGANLQASQTYQSLKHEPVKAVEAQRAEIEKMINKYTAMKKDELGPRKSAIYPDIRHLYKNLNEKVGNILNDLESVDTNRFTVLHSINEKKTLTKLKSYLRDDKQKADGDFAELFEKIKREEEEITEMKENLDSKVSEARKEREDRENILQVNQDDELQPEEEGSNATSASINLQPSAASGANSSTDDVQTRYEFEIGRLITKKEEIDEKLKDPSLDPEVFQHYNKIREEFKSGIQGMSDLSHTFRTISDIKNYIGDETKSFKRLISMKIHNTPSSAAVAASTSPGSGYRPVSQDNGTPNPPVSTRNGSSATAADNRQILNNNGGPQIPSQDLGKLQAIQTAEIRKLKNNLANMTTQKESAKQAAEDKQTEIKKALEKMLTSLKKRLEQEKDNVSEEVNKTIKDKIVEVEGFINNPDLDIKVLTNVEKINKEIENAKYEHEFSANGVKELCESLQELMKQLTRHSRPTLTGGRKTRNNKKKKKSKAKKNKTRRRRRRSNA